MKRRWYRFGIEFGRGDGKSEILKLHLWRWTWTFGQ